jgi:hypothetical protein
VIRRERRVRFELQIDQQRSEKEKRPSARIDQHRVLAEPSEPRAAREISLQQWSGVHVRLADHSAPHALLDPPVQLRETIEHHIVVIVAARISCDGSRRLSTAVVHRDDDRRRRALEWQPRVSTLVGVAR